MVYAAVDIGASSGRVMIGEIKNSKLLTKEIHRFANGFTTHNGVCCWDIDHLLEQTIKGLEKVKSLGMYAMLVPNGHLKQLQEEGRFTERLALFEEFKTYPFGAIWYYYCEQMGVPVKEAWLKEVKQYEREVLFKRQAPSQTV